MSDLARDKEHTFEEYIALEEASNTKHEYFAGEIYAMAGGTPEHAALCANVIATLVSQLKGTDCRVFSLDLRVRVAKTGLATYPDVSIVCGPMKRDSNSKTTIVNPSILIEVLSTSTEKYDTGGKLRHYKQIDSLRACVFISHRKRLIEIHHRSGSSWLTEQTSGKQPLTLAPLDCVLDIDTVYDGVGL